jgi:methionyl-tRNA formyltransferase
MATDSGYQSERLRVVVFTDIPGGVVYHQVDGVLRPLGHRIVGVVTTPGPRPRRSNAFLDVVAAVRPGVDVIVTNHPERLAAMLAPLRPDLIISGGFTWLIPADVIAVPRLGAINMHPSLLPRHRGPHAIEWALRNGEPEIGFSIHRLADGFDTGPILAQGAVPILDDDAIGDVIARFFELVPRLLEQALARVVRREAGEPQDESLATYAGRFEDAWRVIDWTQPARTIHNQVRSWTGTRGMPHGATGELDGGRLIVTRSRLMDRAQTTGSPGTILERRAETLVVQCGDGPLELLAWTVDARAGAP